MERIEKSQERISQLLNIKWKFQIKFEEIISRIKKQRNRRAYKLVFTILKAFLMKKRDEKRETHLAAYVAKKLRFFKVRRIFRAIR